VVEVGTLDVCGGVLGDGAQFLDRGFTSAALKALVAFPKSFHNGAGQGFSGLLGDGPGEPVGFRVLDVKANSSSPFLYHCLPFFILGTGPPRNSRYRMNAQ